MSDAALLERLDRIETELRELRAAVAPAPELVYVSPAQAARRWAVSERHVRELLRSGLPALRLGRRVRIELAAAERWLTERRARAHLRVVGGAR